MTDNKSLPRAEYAERVGVSSKGVQELIDALLAKNVDVHSMMIIRHGAVACEAWREPLTADMPHMVYSVTKSFFATAFGFAVEEGLITKQTRFLDIFPEYTPKKPDEKLEKLTLFNLISMTSGKRPSTSGRKGPDWLDEFVQSDWEFSPGDEWRYSSANYYAAACALVKLTGMSVTQYLTPRLFEPLGIDVPFWETSPDGIEAGGWGLTLKTEDVAKLILCYHNKGMFNGVQVIPESWAVEAVKKQNDNSAVQKKSDCKAGYGYGFWRCAGLPNTFRCEGVYSQYAISMADYDACLVITSSHADLQQTLDIIWEHIPGVFMHDDEQPRGITVKIAPPPAPPVTPHSTLESKLNGRRYKMYRKLFLNIIGLPVSALPMPIIFFSKESCGNVDDVSFSFNGDILTMQWQESHGKYKNSIHAAMDGTYAHGAVEFGELKLDTESYAFWRDESTLEVYIRPTASVATRRFVFRFKGSFISMYPDAIPGIDEKAKTMGETLKTILVGRYFHTWIDILVPLVKYILQPKHFGRVKKK